VSEELKPEGSLAERDVPDLVQALHERHWTGTLTLSNVGVGRSITVQDGRLVFASSSSADDRLGALLVRRGRISYRQYIEAGAAVGPGKRFGTALVEQSALEAKDLPKTVVEHCQEIIYAAFQWTEGRYRLQAGQDSAEAITLRMSTPDLIMEGIRRIESWTRVERGVGGISARYTRAEGYDRVLRAMTLAPEKAAVLEALQGERDVEALCTGSSLPDFEVCRTLWAFRVIGVARRIDLPASRQPQVDDEGLGLLLSE
jgi:hypothetical protein